MPCVESTPEKMPAFDLSLLPPEPDLTFELPLWQAGILSVAGIDEAGRGALAGPVVAAATILPADLNVMEWLRGVRDSKQMAPSQRERARQKIIRYAIAWGIGLASSQEIDQLGILPATRLAACRALSTLKPPPAHLLLDYIELPAIATPQTALVKGDCRSLSIAAASVLAKTSRDAILCELEHTYPGYGFTSHKGYGTRAHREAIRLLGASPVHRQSFTLLGESDDLNSEDSQDLTKDSA
jgi:ribonuclease HII